MGLGIEVDFIFDKEEPSLIFYELKEKYNFDSRNGLNLVISGQDAIEVIEDDDRLIRMLERKLNIDLSILDYWNYRNEDLNDNFINLDLLLEKLQEFKIRIEDNPDFYSKIAYGFDIENRYLKEKLHSDICYLIERIKLNIKNGATKVRFEEL